MTAPELNPVVVNADDFGASEGINRGIVEAHVHGLVTSTSLMVNMPATAHALSISPDLDDLSIGLHVNFTNEGNPIIDVADPIAARSELARQIDVFAELLGRLPTHLDSHHDVHARPELGEVFARAASELGLPLRARSGIRYVAQFYGQADGVTHAERISVPAFLRILRHAAESGPSEISCHPGYHDREFESVYHDEREQELRTLCDDRALRGVEAMGIQLVNFEEIRKLGHL